MGAWCQDFFAFSDFEMVSRVSLRGIEMHSRNAGDGSSGCGEMKGPRVKSVRVSLDGVAAKHGSEFSTRN